MHPDISFAQDKWGALALLVCACVTKRGLCGSVPSHCPAMSHLASSHRVQKSSLARPERRAKSPSYTDISFWVPVMHRVGSQYQFESVCEQSSGYVALAAPGWCKVNAVLACLSAGTVGIHYVW